MQTVLRLRSSFLLVAVIALSVNALAGFASAHGARSAVPVKVISDINFENATTSGVQVAPGQEGEATAKCPAGTVRISGGFVSHGSFNALIGGAPSVLTSVYTPTGWVVHAVNSKTGSLLLVAGVTCADIKYATVMSG